MSRSGTNYQLVHPDGSRKGLRLKSKPLNQGADGVIYAIPGNRIALKIYHEPTKDTERPEKIRQMVQSPPDDEGMAHFAWPTALLTDNAGKFVGFAMPLLPIDQYTNLDLLLSRKGRDIGKLPESREFRVKAALNLATRVAQLHAKGHCIIDLKPANLLVNRTTADIVVVDCDGFAIQGDKSFIPGHQFTTGYIAPEAWKKQAKPETLGKSQDLFALAVIIFQLLNEGLHPYQGVPKGKRPMPSDTQSRIGKNFYAYGKPANPNIGPSPWSLHKDFPPAIATVFKAAFRMSAQRPSASDWINTLENTLGALNTCSKYPDHRFWGKNCPICDLSSVSVKVKRRKRRGSAAASPAHRPQPRPPRPQAPSPTPVAAQSASQQQHPSSSPIFRFMGITFAVLLTLGYFSHLFTEEKRLENSHETRQEAIAKEQALAQEYARREAEALRRHRLASWRELGTLALKISEHHSIHDLPKGRFASYGSGDRKEEASATPIIPHFRLGAFDTDQKLPVLSYAPKEVMWSYTEESPVTLGSLNALTDEFSKPDQTYAVNGEHNLIDWKIHPASQALYVRKCAFQANCYQLARYGADESATLYKVAEQPRNDGAGRRYYQGPWHFELTEDDRHVVIADSERLRVFATNRPGSPVVEMAYPDYLDNMELSDLAMTPDGKRIFAALSRNDNYGMDYEATVLEFAFSDGSLKLITDFRDIWPEDGSVPAPSVAVSHDGSTLVIGHYSDLRNDDTSYQRYGQPVEVKVGLAGIRAWKRKSSSEPWSAQRPYELYREDLIRTPDNVAVFRFSPFGISTFSDRFNLSFQLSPDGKRLASGLEIENHKERSLSAFPRRTIIARAWVLDLETSKPRIQYRLEGHLDHGDRQVERIYPGIRMSEDFHHAVLGWSAVTKPAYTPKQRNLDLSLTTFRLGK